MGNYSNWNACINTIHTLILSQRIRQKEKRWYLVSENTRYCILIYRFADDIELMTGRRPGIYWLICWKYLSPLAMLCILISSFAELAVGGAGYDAWIASEGDTERKSWPIWAVLLVLVLVLASVLWIPVLAICRYIDSYLSTHRNSNFALFSRRRCLWQPQQLN